MNDALLLSAPLTTVMQIPEVLTEHGVPFKVTKNAGDVCLLELECSWKTGQVNIFFESWNDKASVYLVPAQRSLLRRNPHSLELLETLAKLMFENGATNE